MMLLIALSLFSGEAPSEITSVPELPRIQKLAPFSSLIVPGTGELIRGHRLKGEIFLWSDFVVASGVAGFGWDAVSKRNAAIGFAVVNAGANPENRSRDYLAALESFISTDEYDLNLAREARAKYPDDLLAQQEYIQANRYTGENEWMWASDSARLRYLDQRNDMRKSTQVSQTLMAIMVLTRVVSFFDVAFSSPPAQTRLGVVPVTNPQAPGIQLVYRF